MNSTVVLLHVDTSEKVADVINGRLVKLPANEPVEMPEFIGNAVMKHIGEIYGIVIVPQMKTSRGWQWDVEGAVAAAAEKLKRCNEATVNFYVRQQLEDRIGSGKPALPPTGRALSVILANKINLKAMYGFNPVGWDGGTGVGMEPTMAPNNDQSQAQASIRAQKETIASLEAKVNDQATQFDTLVMKFNQLMSMLNPVTDAAEVPDPVPDPVLPTPAVAQKLKKQQ